MTRNMKAGNWQCITTVSCRLLPVMFAETYTAPAYLSARLSLDELLVALNDDALVASTYCLACKVVCLCV